MMQMEVQIRAGSATSHEDLDMAGAKTFTGLLADIEAAAGRAAAEKLAEVKGGSRVFIPGTARPGHWLTDLLGIETAEKVCFLCRGADKGGTYQKIPRGNQTFYEKAREKIDALLAQGLSNDKVALEVGVDLSTVQRRRKKIGLLPPQPAQMALFA